ncbi:MAG: flavodoxin [Muribaculaceae bacterium]|nr:flavodoxin [Muribaculaceae bacterium]
MKTMNALFTLALCLIASTACKGTAAPAGDAEAAGPEVNTTEAVQSDVKAGQKALIVFFSHAGDNYSVGNIEVGNTKIVADYITELTGAEQFEIKTSKYDGMAYKPLCDLALEEQRKGELPPFEGTVDVASYQTIFIGGPVWWGTWPQVMFTFFKQYDLSGKTLIPFTTHEGSGLGNCVKDLKKLYPDATVTGEFSMYGHDVRGGKARVEKWLKGLGYGK